MRGFATLLLALYCSLLSADGQGSLDWAAFLARSDPVNDFTIHDPFSMPDVSLEASFAGNGMMGAQVMVCPGGMCRQSLLLGTSKAPPPLGAPHQAVIAIARADVSDMRTGEWKPCFLCYIRRYCRRTFWREM